MLILSFRYHLLFFTFSFFSFFGESENKSTEKAVCPFAWVAVVAAKYIRRIGSIEAGIQKNGSSTKNEEQCSRVQNFGIQYDLVIRFSMVARSCSPPFSNNTALASKRQASLATQRKVLIWLYVK